MWANPGYPGSQDDDEGTFTFHFSCLTLYKISTCLQNTIRDLDQSAGLAEDGPDGLHARGALAVHHGHPGLVLESFLFKISEVWIMFTWSMLLRKRNCLAITTSTTVTYTSTRPWKHNLVTRELRLQNVMSWLLLNQSFYIKEL